MKQSKSIPTILGLLLLLGAVFGGVILTSQKSSLGSKAGGSCDPSNPQVTNITYNSATISFTTSTDCLSSVNVDNQVIKNDVSSKVHYFNINSLKENSDYTFSIISGGASFESSNYQINTAQKPSSEAISSDLAWGKVLNSNNTPADKVIIYLNIPGASPLSALTTSSGNWNIPLSTSFNESKTNWFNPSANIEENIYVLSSDQSTTQIVNNTSKNDPVPDIIIGQNSLTAPEVDTTSVGSLPNSNLNSDLTNDQKLDVSNPAENETISTKKPEFFGTAPAKTKITIEVHSSEVINGQTTSDEDGTWEWSVPDNLSPGEHTITVTAKNEETGIIETITRKFIVLAAENDTNFTASSSATTPTVTPTIKVTPTPTTTPTSSVTKIEKPSTSSGVPQTGVTLPTFTIIIAAIFFLSISLIFYIKN